MWGSVLSGIGSFLWSKVMNWIGQKTEQNAQAEVKTLRMHIQEKEAAKAAQKKIKEAGNDIKRRDATTEEGGRDYTDWNRPDGDDGGV